MPIHDWTSVNAAYFHNFYLTWIGAISNGLKRGVLPSSHYAFCENHRDGRTSAFLELGEAPSGWVDPGDPGKTRYIDDGLPATSIHDVCTHPEYADKVITVRRSDHNGVVAAIRVLTPPIKRSRYRMDQFVGWAVEVIRDGVSLLVIDLFEPGPHDPQGIHQRIWDEFTTNDFRLPHAKALTLASYLGKPTPEAFVETTALGQELIDMPLFLDAQCYVEVPLVQTYRQTFADEPAPIRQLFGE